MVSPRLHETDGENHVLPSRGPCEVVVSFHASAQAILHTADTTLLCGIREGNNRQSQWAIPQSYPSQYILLPSENKLATENKPTTESTSTCVWSSHRSEELRKQQFCRRLTILTLFWGIIIHISIIDFEYSISYQWSFCYCEFFCLKL